MRDHIYAYAEYRTEKDGKEVEKQEDEYKGKANSNIAIRSYETVCRSHKNNTLPASLNTLNTKIHWKEYTNERYNTFLHYHYVNYRTRKD